MTLRRLIPSDLTFSSESLEQESWVVAKEFGICDGWRINFAVNLSGAFHDEHGSSRGISNDLDRLLLSRLRSQADVIVTTGETARQERYKSSKHAPIAILTSSADLIDVPAIQGSQFHRPLVIVPSGKADLAETRLSDVDVKILEYNTTLEAWPAAVAELLKHEGFQSPVFEGGPSVAAEFLNAGIIREICLTVTKHSNQQFSAGYLAPTFVNNLFGSNLPLRLASLFVEDDNLFTRWLTV